MMEEKRTRRVFPREFKVDAVQLLLNSGQTAVEVARIPELRRAKPDRLFVGYAELIAK